MSGTLTWSYEISTHWGVYGSVILTTSDVPNVSGDYLAATVAGTWNGQAIVALEASDGSGFAHADNLLSLTDTGFANGLDGAGLSFSTTYNDATLWVNLYSDGGGSIIVTETNDWTLLNSTYYNSGAATSVSLSSSCYLSGTYILTPAGEVKIEDLRHGDLVVTRFGGFRSVRWIGRQSFLGRFLGHKRAPICIRAGALADHSPRRDLWVSPDHSLLLNDRLVHASLLVNGVTITQTEVSGVVDYLHVDLGEHDCLLADGAWAESYAERGNRTSFHNAADYVPYLPEVAGSRQSMCRPQVRGGDPELLALRAIVAARVPPSAQASGHDLHILIDWVRIGPIEITGESWIFDIPANVTTIKLVSHACKPSTLGLAADDRILGFRVTAIRVRSPTSDMLFSPANPLLQEGFHEAEQDGYRWTDGFATLPIALLADDAGPTSLTITGHGLPYYILEREAA